MHIFFIILHIEYCFKMFKIKRRVIECLIIKIIIPVAVLCFVIILAIAYAAFTSNLNISGTGNVRDSKWKVYFSRLSEAHVTGTATVSMPTLVQNATSIGDYTATVMSPGDSISFEVDVTNDGDYDALLSNVAINGTSTCKYNNDATDTSAERKP